jgi:hypothetical protein
VLAKDADKPKEDAPEFEEVIKRMLNTPPPKKKSEKKKKPAK